MKNFSSKTKVNYPRNSKRERIIRLVFVAGVLVVSLVLFGSMIGKVVSTLTTPLYAVTAWFRESAAPLPLYIRERSLLLDEMQLLKEDLSAKSGSDATISRLSIENETLKSLLSVKDDGRIASGILARPPYLPYDALLIDRGTDDGIEEGSTVYHAYDEAIGFVSKVMKQSALVTLYSANGVKATAYIFGPNIYVDMYGEGGGVIRLSVPQGVVVSVGDPVVLPGLDMGILGIVSEVRSVPTEPEQQAYITLTVPIQSLYTVGVSSRVVERVSYEEAEKRIREWDYHALGIDIPDMNSYETQGSSTTERNTEIE